MLVSNELSIRVTSQIELKLPEMSDAQEIFSVVDKNRAHLRTFMAWIDDSKTPEDTAAFLEGELGKVVKGEALLFKILYNENFAGLIGSEHIDFLNRTADVGYWLDSAAEGKGIMTRSLQALIELYFHELNLHRVELRCAVENKKSIAVANRLGFKNEGRMTQALAHYDNTFLDAYLFAKVNS